MVFIRSTFKFIAVVLYIASTTEAFYVPPSDYTHSKRNTASRNNVIVLSTRELSELGVRSEGISHILVVRTPAGSSSGSRTPTPDGFPQTKAETDRQIAYWKKEMDKSAASVKTLQDSLKTAQAAVKKAKSDLKKAKANDKKKFEDVVKAAEQAVEKVENKLHTAREAKKGAEERIEDLEAHKNTLPN